MYENIILSVGLYGYETWSVTLMDERRLRVFENKLLRKIHGLNWDEVRGEWKKLHKKEFYDLTPKES